MFVGRDAGGRATGVGSLGCTEGRQSSISQKMLLSLAVLLCSVTCGVWRLPRACHTLPESASWLSIYKYYAIRNMCAVHTSVWDTIAP